MLMILSLVGCNILHKVGKNSEAPNVASEQRVGRVFILSGPSGVGKTTVGDRLIEHFSGRLMKMVAMTTRPPRPGEVEGVDYHFIDDATFSKYAKENKFLEWATVHQKYHYGTLAEPIFSNIKNGIDSLLVIDTQGVEQIRKNFPDFAESMITIFIKPKNLEVLRERLGMRGTEKSEDIDRRLTSVKAEMEASETYQHVVISGTRDEDFAAVVKIFEDPSTASTTDTLSLQENGATENKKTTPPKVRRTKVKLSRKTGVKKPRKVKNSSKAADLGLKKSLDSEKSKVSKRKARTIKNPDSKKPKRKKSPKAFTVDQIPIGPSPVGPIFS